MCRTEYALRRRRCWLAAAACACTAAAAAFAGASGHGRAVGILDGRGAGFRTVLVNAAHAAGIMREKRPADREGADGRLKHIVIDKVYFPKDREDAGIAAVHGWINGNFVQGDLQLQRTAKYNAADGSWLGVPNRPPRLSTYKSAAEGVVAHSIRAAMQSLSTHKQQVPPTSLVKLNSLGRDPETALTIDIAKAAHQAVEEVLNAESAHETVAKLKARRARVFQLKRVRRRLPSRQLRARWRRPGPKSKTLRGCTCLAPCSRRGGQRAWCFTAGSCGFQARRAGSSANAAGQFWDHCEPELVRTVKGCECDFPFEFQGSRMHACIDSSRTFLWGAEAPPHSGQPRGIWCKTKGDCGAGEFTPAKGLRSVKWDHCDLPPTHADTAQTVASAARLSSLATPAGGGVARPLQGQQGQGRACGATIGDARAHAKPMYFSRECGSGGVCAYACSDPAYCPGCAGGNCKCEAGLLKAGARCGLRSNRPPAYSSYQCRSGQCVFACDGMGAQCSQCNAGNCICV